MRRVQLVVVLVALLLGLVGHVQGQPAVIVDPQHQKVNNWWNGLQNRMGARLLACDALAFAIDNSGSIRASGRLAWERACALRALEELAKMNLEVRRGTVEVKAGRNNPTVVIYAFNANISKLVLPAQPAQPAQLKDLVQVNAAGTGVTLSKQTKNAIAGIRDTGNLTWLSGAVAGDANNRQCPFNGGNARVLFLFTDHEPTTPTRKGTFQPGAAMAAFRAAVNWFLLNCSTMILTAFDAVGTSADGFFTKVVAANSEACLYVNVPTVSTPAQQGPVTIAFAGTEPNTGRTAVLPDASIHLGAEKTLTFHVSWNLGAAAARQWQLWVDNRDNDLLERSSLQGVEQGVELGLSHQSTEVRTGAANAAKGSAVVTVPLPSTEGQRDRPGWSYQVFVMQGQQLVAQSNVLEVTLLEDLLHIGGLAASDGRSTARGDSYYADRYEFKGVSGERVEIRLDSVDFDFDAYLYLIGPNGDVLAFNDDGGEESNAVVTFTLKSSGTYVMEATSYDPDSVGNYTLARRTVEPCAVPRSSIALGGTATGTLGGCKSDARGPHYLADYYAFSGASGQKVEIRLNSSDFDAYLYLRGPDNAMLQWNDDGGEGTDSFITFTLPAAGSYVIEVTSHLEAQLGSYTLTLSAAGAGE